MRPRNIEVHIEELVLHGFPARDRERIRTALEAELARQFGASDASSSLSQDRELGRVDAGGFALARGASPDVVGVQTAQALYRGLCQ